MNDLKKISIALDIKTILNWLNELSIFFSFKGMRKIIRRNRLTGSHRFQSYQFIAV